MSDAAARIGALAATVAQRMDGVMGERRERSDAPLLERYPSDRAACEARIQAAQAALDGAGTGADPKENAYDLAWAWQRLDDALQELAHLEARVRLARRRQTLAQGRDAKETRHE